MNRIFSVVDLETTGLDSKNDHIIEFACTIVDDTRSHFDNMFLGMEASFLIKPPVSIPSNLSAIHHIVDADVRDQPTLDEAQSKLKFWCRNSIMVAHNADFEKSFIVPKIVTPETLWVCTWKCALRLWEDAPSHSNVALGYMLGILKGRSDAFHAAHTAGYDAHLTAQILMVMLNLTSLEQLLEWSNEPAFLKRCPIGKHRDQLWEDVPFSYLTWLLKEESMREDVKHAARQEVLRRSRVTQGSPD